MIKFDDMLLKFKNIMIFKLKQQLLKLIKKFKRNRNIEEWKRHIRFLQTYCRFDDKAVNKNFRIFCDEKNFNFKNSSLKTFKGNSKARKNKNSKETSISVTSLTVVKDSVFKAFKSFKITFFSKIKRNSRVLRWL